jgi:thymidylate synthase
MLTINQLRNRFAVKYENDEIHNGTVEIVGESFLANEATIFGEPNEDYIDRELAWYLSGSLNVNDIPGGTPTIWKQVASPAGEINSNYGHLLFSEENGSQFERVLETLVADPNSRRATAVYTRPSIHEDWNRDGMTDFICTNAIQYLIRDGKLQVVVQMRSNDVVFGYRNDYAWQKTMQMALIDDLSFHGIDVVAGDIIWNAASLHVYERHFKLIETYLLDRRRGVIE